MATGYDNRETTRRSFAFAPQPARQVNTAANARPNIGRSGNVGSAATGGGNVIMSENPTAGSGAGAQIPAFLNAVLEPHIKAQQERRVREGMTAAMNGTALAEIEANQPGLSALFGPTDFQRGAQFFATQKAVSDWKTEQLASLSTLRELPPEDLPRYLNEAAMNHMTGDVYADNAINQAIIEESATLIPRIAQARAEWQQNTLRTGAIDNNLAAGAAYSALIQSYVTQPELSEGETDPLAGQRIDEAAIARQRETFLATFMPIAGMSEEAFKSSVLETAQGFLAEDNLWAYNALSEGGTDSILFQTLTPEQRASLDSAYTAAGRRAQSRALMQIGPEYDLFRARVRLGSLAEDPIAPDEVRAQLDEFNVRIASLTGYDTPYFDAENMIRQTEEVTGGVVSDLERARTRRQAEEDKAAEEQAVLDDIAAAASTGDFQAAIIEHGEGKVNAWVTAAIRSDPATTIPMLIASHRNSGEVISGARNILQAQVAANIASGYDSASFQTAYSNWKAFSTEQSGAPARAAYYGAYDTMFARMGQLMSDGGVTGTLAYAQTFGEAGALAGTQQAPTAPTGERREALIGALRQEVDPGFWQRTFGATQLSPTGQATIERLALGGASLRMDAEGMDAKTAIQSEISSLRADNRVEIVGRDAWANPSRGPSMGTLTGVPTDRLGNVWQQLVNEGRARVGAENRPYTVWRSGEGTATRWIVSVTASQGKPSEVFQIDVPMISRADATRESEDVTMRREAAAYARWSQTREGFRENSWDAPGARARFSTSFRRGDANPTGRRP